MPGRTVSRYAVWLLFGALALFASVRAQTKKCPDAAPTVTVTVRASNGKPATEAHLSAYFYRRTEPPSEGQESGIVLTVTQKEGVFSVQSKGSGFYRFKVTVGELSVPTVDKDLPNRDTCWNVSIPAAPQGKPGGSTDDGTVPSTEHKSAPSPPAILKDTAGNTLPHQKFKLKTLHSGEVENTTGENGEFNPLVNGTPPPPRKYELSIQCANGGVVSSSATLDAQKGWTLEPVDISQCPVGSTNNGTTTYTLTIPPTQSTQSTSDWWLYLIGLLGLFLLIFQVFILMQRRPPAPDLNRLADTKAHLSNLSQRIEKARADLQNNKTRIPPPAEPLLDPAPEPVMTPSSDSRSGDRQVSSLRFEEPQGGVRLPIYLGETTPPIEAPPPLRPPNIIDKYEQARCSSDDQEFSHHYPYQRLSLTNSKEVEVNPGSVTPEFEPAERGWFLAVEQQGETLCFPWFSYLSQQRQTFRLAFEYEGSGPFRLIQAARLTRNGNSWRLAGRGRIVSEG